MEKDKPCSGEREFIIGYENSKICTSINESRDYKVVSKLQFRDEASTRRIDMILLGEETKDEHPENTRNDTCRIGAV